MNVKRICMPSKPHYLIIDTCVWIELGKEFIEVREKITHLLSQGKIILILPQIVLDEWEKNKYKIVEHNKNSIHGKIKNAKGLIPLCKPEVASTLTEILNELEKNKEVIEKSALLQKEAIETLFSNNSTIKIETTDETKFQAIDFALAKKAPFKMKTSMADALIVLGAINYVRQEKLDNCLFVSHNTKDFQSTSNKTQVHEDLKELFDECGMQYFSNIGQAINKIEKDLVSAESIQEIEKTQQFKGFIENYKELIDKHNEELKKIGALIPGAIGSSIFKGLFGNNSEELEGLGKSMSAAMGNLAFKGVLSLYNEELKKAGTFVTDAMESSALNGLLGNHSEELKRLGESAAQALEVLNSHKELSKQNKEMMKSIIDASGYSNLSEIISQSDLVSQRLTTNINAAIGISTLQKTFGKLNQEFRDVEKSIGALVGISDLQEKFSQPYQALRDLENSINEAFGITTLKEVCNKLNQEILR